MAEYLTDGPVQVSGRLIIPAALMLEMALTAGATLAGSSAAPFLALCGVSISAPLILPSVAAHSHVEASLGYANGALELRSTPHSSNSRWTSHCRGSFAAISTPSAGKPATDIAPPDLRCAAKVALS
jgi:hypothetical protein